ncbi:MAG: Alpha/Beta hydrolase protein [Podila humilis]|nr:MAG: Alpha/Beta hydrolase protein [Podila humilis]
MIPTKYDTETVNFGLQSVVDIPGQGSVRGVRDEGRSLARFLNIPYAVVTKRWRQASPVKPWLDVRDATRYGPMCPQTLVRKSNGLIKLFGMPAVDDGFQYLFSERDCLNLCIYVPALEAPPPVGGIPVIVYIHGGKLRHGGNAHPVYDMSNFVHASVKANQPVIVVVINYRLGCLGYFASRELAFEFDSDPDNILHHRTHDQDPAFGNWGLADQKLAFEWVREHIGVFGGNASNVTVMGYSGGGTAIMNHMLIQNHHGLFSRAIVHSGGAGLIFARSLEAVDNLRLGLGAAHGTDMGFTTMSDLSQQYMTEQEKAFGHSVMEKYFRFAYGLEDELIPVETDMVDWKAGGKDGSQAFHCDVAFDPSVFGS